MKRAKIDLPEMILSSLETSVQLMEDVQDHPSGNPEFDQAIAQISRQMQELWQKFDLGPTPGELDEQFNKLVQAVQNHDIRSFLIK